MRPDPQRQVPDPGHQEVHARVPTAGTIGPPTLVQYDLGDEEDRADDSLAEGRGARGRGRDVLARRQAHVHVRRGHPHLRDDELHGGRSLGCLAADRAGRRARRIGGLDPFSDEPGFYTGLFTMQDPAAEPPDHGHRPHRAGEEEDRLPSDRPGTRLGFAVAPDRKRGYGLLRDIGEYEFWTFDLENYRVIDRDAVHAAGRAWACASAATATIIYIHTAGNTIDLLRRGDVQAACARSRSTAT